VGRVVGQIEAALQSEVCLLGIRESNLAGPSQPLDLARGRGLMLELANPDQALELR
jgi:hypothetical protein